MKGEFKYIECGNLRCFKSNGRINCLNCPSGKVFVICFNCGKRHYIDSEIRRVDCECGAGFIPVYNQSIFVGVPEK